MRDAFGHNYRNSSFIVDVAMGQILWVVGRCRLLPGTHTELLRGNVVILVEYATTRRRFELFVCKQELTLRMSDSQSKSV